MKGEAGVVVAHGQACWEAPSSSSSGMDVLDEEVAGLRLDVEWTEGVEEQVRELLERSTLKRGEFDGVHDTVEVSTNMCVRRR